MKSGIVFVLTAMLMIATGVAAQESGVRREALERWESNRFGMFIHWGPVSISGQEISWSRANSNTNCPNNGPIPTNVYDHFYQSFDPTNFNAADWVAIAGTAGMKYMILTAKHADGFLLWPSKVDPYNIGATPFHRDVCRELAAAAQQQGMAIGWYFSPMDWRDPDCRSTHNDRFNGKCREELRELLSNYGQISVVWFDTDGKPAEWDPAKTYALVRKLQPGVLLDNRLEMSTHVQWAHQDSLRPEEDFMTPEQRIGAYDNKHPWETCMTLGTQWSWKPNDALKTAAGVIGILARTIGGDGNLLLDVGPMPDGRIEPRQVQILKQVGVWLQQNGESVYGTRGGPWKPSRTLASTRKGNVVYVHILGSSNKDTIELPTIPRNVQSASLLDGTVVSVKKREGKLVVSVPANRRDAADTVVKLTFEGTVMDLAAVDVTPAIKASASNVYQDDALDYGPQMAFDDDEGTRWATDEATKPAWITATFPSPQPVGHLTISEAYDRVRKFEFQFRDGKEWKTIFTGTTLGEHFEKRFNPVKAREFRLNILDATQGPTLNEIELLNQ